MKNEKKFELISLTRTGGGYVAGLYNRLGGYYKNVSFIWYNKKQVISLLRNKYDCIVPARFG